ncbi:MAG: TonB family protein [Nibricoccus sp.]
MTDDAALLRRYLDGSEAAFAELVQCHIGAVYGTALRLVAGDAHLADDVTQKVFTGLARKASSLADRPVLIGWLYLSTQYEAAKAIRSEQRWRNREQKAHVMNEIENQGAVEPDWSSLRPVLDSAMRDLKEGDRDALLLRFFQSRTLAEVGEALGLSENAARMRVDRALEKLHSLLVRRGIKSTATALGTVLAGQVVTAAPASLAATVTTTALAGAATATGATIVFMGMTKFQAGVAAAIVVAGGSALWSQRETGSQLQAENSALVQRATDISQAKTESARLDAETQRIALLRQEAARLDALRAEEAELLQALRERAKPAADASVPLRQTPDGKPLYTIKQLDQMPVPRLRVQPVYPLELKKIGVGGDVLVEFTIAPDGDVKDVNVAKATHEALAAAAQEAIVKWKFKPGQKGGLPVNARLQQPFVFSIEYDDNAEWF